MDVRELSGCVTRDQLIALLLRSSAPPAAVDEWRREASRRGVRLVVDA